MQVGNRPEKIIAWDLDGVLCTRPEGLDHLGIDKYRHCIPNQKMIDIVNQQFEKGYTIVIYTARGMNQFNGDIKMVYDQLFELTNQSLIDWGVKFNYVSMGKIDYDMLIDDKAMGIDNLEKIERL